MTRRDYVMLSAVFKKEIGAAHAVLADSKSSDVAFTRARGSIESAGRLAHQVGLKLYEDNPAGFRLSRFLTDCGLPGHYPEG